jgi:ribosomal-protein-alanine N-acetyltransferase
MNGRAAIEPGGVDDLAAVMRVMDDSFDAEFGEAWTAPQCAGLLPMPGVWLALVREEGEIVGFALARVVVREAELLLLAVMKDSQGKGIGQLLLDHFIADSKRRGAEHLHLEVREGNRAIRLYKRVGFREIGRRRNYYSGRGGQLYDALTLARTANS